MKKMEHTEGWARWQPELYRKQAPDWTPERRNEVLEWLLQHPETTPEVCEALICAGANPNYVDEFGRTPLIVTSMWGRVDLARVLLAHRADPNIGTSTRSPIKAAVMHDAPVGMIHLLVQYGVILSPLLDFDSPLNVALAMGRLAPAHALLDYGVRSVSKSSWNLQCILLERRSRCQSAARTLYGILRYRLSAICSWGGYPLQREIAQRAAVLVWATRAHVTPWSQEHARPPIEDPTPK